MWNYTQEAIRLNIDQDGDSISTEHELGGYDVNEDGVSDTPLHLYGANPFTKVLYYIYIICLNVIFTNLIKLGYFCGGRLHGRAQ